MSNLWWSPVVALELLIAVTVYYSGLGNYDPSYDSGVYLESARMISRGYLSYHEVFSSQPPLWLPLLRFSFVLFGENFLAAQVLMATASLITVAAVIATAAQLKGRLSAILAAALVIFSPIELTWSRSAMAEVSSMTFAAVAIAFAARYFCAGRRCWLVLAALAISCSTLTKLFGLYTVPAVLALIAARWRHAFLLKPRAALGCLSYDLVIFATVAMTTIILTGLSIDLRKVWDQAVRFHWAARSSGVGGEDFVEILLHSGWAGWNISLGLAVLCVFGGSPGLVILIWLLCTFVGVLQQKPLYAHHMLPLMAPFAVAVGFGLELLWRWSIYYWSRAHYLFLHLLAGSGCAACLLIALFFVLKVSTIARANDYFIKPSASETERIEADTAIAKTLQRLTSSNQPVLTDAQGIAFLAHRDVPPGLTDTSFTRISSGYLSARQVIDDSRRFHIRAALLWTGRLKQMPEVVAWLKVQFPRHQSFGEGRELYYMP